MRLSTGTSSARPGVSRSMHQAVSRVCLSSATSFSHSHSCGAAGRFGPFDRRPPRPTRAVADDDLPEAFCRSDMALEQCTSFTEKLIYNREGDAPSGVNRAHTHTHSGRNFHSYGTTVASRAVTGTAQPCLSPVTWQNAEGTMPGWPSSDECKVTWLCANCRRKEGPGQCNGMRGAGPSTNQAECHHVVGWPPATHCTTNTVILTTHVSWWVRVWTRSVVESCCPSEQLNMMHPTHFVSCVAVVSVMRRHAGPMQKQLQVETFVDAYQMVTSFV